MSAPEETPTEETLKKIEGHWTSHDSHAGEANIAMLIGAVRRLKAEVARLQRLNELRAAGELHAAITRRQT